MAAMHVLHGPQIDQLRQMYRIQWRVARYATLLWLAPAVLLGIAIAASASALLCGVLALLAVGGLVQHFNEVVRLRDYRSRFISAAHPGHHG